MIESSIPPTLKDVVSDPLQQELDSLADEYSAHWSPDSRSRISDLLQRVVGDRQSQLLKRLLEVDLQLREKAGQEILPQDYQELGDAAVSLVIELLEGDEGTSTMMLEGPESHDLPTTAPVSSNPLPADEIRQIGNFKLLQQIGEGGMGAVWLAEQEKPVRRKVALKLIKPGMGSKETIARFEAERQALAMMDHQNIAKILDGGTTEFGNPYFVMELVEGAPITRYCDENKLSIKERLDLFIPVCRAVQHAHQKGIIHRDLKPNNVLVTLQDDKPVPKVIDFGLAKALEHTTKLTDNTVFTEIGTVVGTIQYMAPEQAETGELDVDTRTDVYSLGVILYELLTGSTPLDAESVRQNALIQVLSLIRENEPPRPSARLSGTGDAISSISDQRRIPPAKLQQILRGELDWIVMKALEKSRHRRYETALGLADDVHRFLTHETVMARPPSKVYRLRKFVRKHRAAVTSAALILFLLIAAVTGTSYGFLWALTEAEIAENAKMDADKQKQKALRARDDVQREKANVDNELARSQRLLYANNIQFALREWEAGDIVAALKQWNECPPALRNWEHNYLGRLFTRGRRSIRSVGYRSRTDISPDGTRIAEATENGLLCTWNAIDLTSLKTVKAHTKPIADVAYSPDGDLIASCSSDGFLKIWDADSLEPKQSINSSNCYSFTFSSDGQKVAGNIGNSFKIWDVTTGDEELSISSDDLNGARPTALYPTGNYAVAGHFDGHLSVWDLKTQKQTMNLTGHSFMVFEVAVSPDGKLLASGGADQTVRLWDANTGESLHTLTGHLGRLSSLAFSPDSKTLVSGSEDKTIKLWDTESGRLKNTLKGHTRRVNSVACRQNGQIVSSGDDQTIKVFSISEMEPVTMQVFTGISPLSVHSLAFNSDDSELLSGSNNLSGPIRRWSPITGQPLGTLGAVDDISAPATVALSKNAKWLAFPFQSKTIWLKDCKTGKTIRKFVGHSGSIDSIAFDAQQDRMVTSSPDKTIIVWDVNSGDKLLTIDCGEFASTSIGFNAAGTRIASADYRSLRQWNPESPNPMWEKKSSYVSTLAYTPTGNRLIAGNLTGQLTEYNVTDGEVLRTIKAHTSEITAIAFHPSSNRMVTASADTILKVWDTRTWQHLITLRGHTAVITCVTFNQKGDMLASSSRDQTIRIWDASRQMK